MDYEQIMLEGANILSIFQEFQKKFNPEFEFQTNSTRTIIYILENYSFRVNSRMSIIVIVDQQANDRYFISIIAAGGSSGILGNDWGAENSRVQRIKSFIVDQARSKQINAIPNSISR